MFSNLLSQMLKKQRGRTLKAYQTTMENVSCNFNNIKLQTSDLGHKKLMLQSGILFSYLLQYIYTKLGVRQFSFFDLK